MSDTSDSARCVCGRIGRSGRYSRFPGVTVVPVLAVVLTERSETAAMDSFSGVTIATARSTIGPTRSSLARRSHSANNCSIYAFLRFNTSLRQLQREIEVTYKTIHRRVERFAEALDAPSLELRGPVEVDEFYVSTGIKGHERDQRSRFCGLSRRGCGTYDQDKSPVFVLVDRGTEQRYVVPAKSADESTIRLLLTDRQQELSPPIPTYFARTIRLQKTKHSTASTSFTETVSPPTRRFTGTPARATRRWRDGGSRRIEAL